MPGMQWEINHRIWGFSRFPLEKYRNGPLKKTLSDENMGFATSWRPEIWLQHFWSLNLSCGVFWRFFCEVFWENGGKNTRFLGVAEKCSVAAQGCWPKQGTNLVHPRIPWSLTHQPSLGTTVSTGWYAQGIRKIRVCRTEGWAIQESSWWGSWLASTDEKSCDGRWENKQEMGQGYLFGIFLMGYPTSNRLDMIFKALSKNKVYKYDIHCTPFKKALLTGKMMIHSWIWGHPIFRQSHWEQMTTGNLQLRLC